MPLEKVLEKTEDSILTYEKHNNHISWPEFLAHTFLQLPIFYLVFLKLLVVFEEMDMEMMMDKDMLLLVG